MSLAAYASETNKNVLTAAFSLAYFKIKSRNEEGINSTRKVFYFPLYPRLVFLNIFTFCFWIDLVHVLATTGNTSAVAGYTHV